MTSYIYNTGAGAVVGPITYSSRKELLHFRANYYNYRQALQRRYDVLINNTKNNSSSPSDAKEYELGEIGTWLMYIRSVVMSVDPETLTITWRHRQARASKLGAYIEANNLQLAEPDSSPEMPLEAPEGGSFISPTAIAKTGFNLSPAKPDEVAPPTELYQDPLELLTKIKEDNTVVFDLTDSQPTDPVVPPSQEKRAKKIEVYNTLRNSFESNKRKKLDTTLKPNTIKILEKLCAEYDDLEPFWDEKLLSIHKSAKAAAAIDKRD